MMSLIKHMKASFIVGDDKMHSASSQQDKKQKLSKVHPSHGRTQRNLNESERCF